MSAQVLSRVRNKFSVDSVNPCLELVRLAPEWQEALQRFLLDIKDCGDDVFFSPHLTDIDLIRSLAERDSKDMFYLLVEQEHVLGYGLLRGWDEGYQIPSLGLAIHPSARGQGLGTMLMDFLHLMASRKGAEKVRLRVLANNEKALRLYKNLGYSFEEDTSLSCFLVGFKNIRRKP